MTEAATDARAGAHQILHQLVGHTHNNVTRLATQAAESLLGGGAKPRDDQVSCIAAAFEGRDVFAQMHTGAGKSLIFQALAQVERQRSGAGCGLVISPITALSDDHVDNARRHGLRAHAYHTRMDSNDRAEGIKAWRNGECDLYMVSPEALSVPTSHMIRALQERPPSNISVDESHLIHMWGRGFRPAYRKVRENLERHLSDAANQVSYVALSATVTDTIERDVIDNLKLNNVYRHKGSVLRNNLRIRLASVGGSDVADYPKVLLPLLDHADGPQILYAQYARDAERLSAALRGRWKRSVTRYHAKERPTEDNPLRWQQGTAEEFARGNAKCMIATNAYGMGINLPFEVRSVVCLGPPSSLAELIQQIGRAGRKGSESLGTLLYSPELLRNQKRLVEMSWPDPSVLTNVLERHTQQQGDIWTVHLPGVPRDAEGKPRVNDVGNVLSSGSKDIKHDSATMHLFGLGLLEPIEKPWHPNARYAGTDYQVANGAFDRVEEVLEMIYTGQRAHAVADAEAVHGFIDRVSRGACAQEELMAAFNDPNQGKVCAELDALACSSCDQNDTLTTAADAARGDVRQASDWMIECAA